MPSFWMILAVGLVLLVVSALRDRQTRRRYLAVTDPASVRPRLPRLDDAALAELDAFRAVATRLTARLADDAFATHADPPRAVVGRAQLLCCPDGVTSLRELLPSLAAARVAMEPLVIALPVVDESLRTGLARSRGLVVLVAEPQACRELAALGGARPAGAAELQAGLGSALHGRLARMLVEDDVCWVEGVEA